MTYRDKRNNSSLYVMEPNNSRRRKTPKAQPKRDWSNYNKKMKM
jgi:hypothetical protein